MRRAVVIVLSAFLAGLLTAVCVLAPANALADSSGGAQSTAPTTTIDTSFLDTKRQLTECVNHSVQLPDCGVVSSAPGARGGALQLATFAILTLAIAFIAWRVVRSIRARDAALGSR